MNKKSHLSYPPFAEADPEAGTHSSESLSFASSSEMGLTPTELDELAAVLQELPMLLRMAMESDVLV